MGQYRFKPILLILLITIAILGVTSTGIVLAENMQAFLANQGKYMLLIVQQTLMNRER